MAGRKARRDPYPEFNRLEKLPGVDYSPRSFADATVMKQFPEQYKRNCENDPHRNPALR